jgi:hypothetical protein
MSTPEVGKFPERMGRIEELVRVIESVADPALGDQVRELVRAILDLHLAGLRAMVGLITQAGAAGQAILDACDGDDLVRSLLLLHGLHPHRLETRVQQVLTELEPLLVHHGITLTLIDAALGVVRLRKEGTPLTSLMKNLIVGTVLEAVPDVSTIEVEEASQYSVDPPVRAIPLPVLPEADRAAPRGPWRGAGEPSAGVGS